MIPGGKSNQRNGNAAVQLTSLIGVLEKRDRRAFDCTQAIHARDQFPAGPHYQPGRRAQRENASRRTLEKARNTPSASNKSARECRNFCTAVRWRTEPSIV